MNLHWLRSSAPISLSIFAVLIMGTHTVDQQHTVYPEMNLYRPSNVSGNATYNCSIITPGGAILTWEVERQQIIIPQQFMNFADRGIYIDPWPTNNTVIVTTLVVSEQARQSYKNLSVQCVARRNLQSIKVPRERPYYIIFYDPPSAIIMDKLQLVPMDEDLILRWDRPSNVLIEVAVNYTIIINSTFDSTAVYNQYFTTNETSVSLQFLQAQILNDNAGDDCITFELSVSAGNDAGSAELTTIMDSIPLSIDIRDVSDTLKVERVNLYPLLVEISFLQVIPCNMRYPLSNYSIKVDNASARVIHTFDDSMKPFEKDGRVRLELNETTLPGVTLDGSFNLTVSACNDITCRESNSITFNTTDIQDVKAVFYKNHLFLQCTFTEDSKAQGCALNLTLFGNNGTETYELYRKNGDKRCFPINNQLGAYRNIVIFDIEEDGASGNIGLTIDEPVNVSMKENFEEITDCDIDANVIIMSSDSRLAERVGGALGSVMAIVILACILIPIIVAVICRRLKKPSVAVSVTRHQQSKGIDGPGEETKNKPATAVESTDGACEETKDKAATALELSTESDGSKLQETKMDPNVQTDGACEETKDKAATALELRRIRTDGSKLQEFETKTDPNVEKYRNIGGMLSKHNICSFSEKKNTIKIDLRKFTQCFPGAQEEKLKLEFI